MTFVKNPYLDDIMRVFNEVKPPARFTVDVEYDTETGVVNFILYADQWHSLPEYKILSCAEWVNNRLTVLRDMGITISLEKRDAAP